MENIVTLVIKGTQPLPQSGKEISNSIHEEKKVVPNRDRMAKQYTHVHMKIIVLSHRYK